MPMGLGDMDASLYLLFKAIREQSTVALSGESADEVFGGYRQFHDPAVQQADTFPWLAIGSPGPSVPTGEHPRRRRCVPRLWTCRPTSSARYAEAVAEVAQRLDGERRLRASACGRCATCT